MRKLVGEDKKIEFGIYDQPVDLINYQDYKLRDPFDRRVSALRKALLFKQFNFFGILSPKISLGLAIIDLRYLRSAFFYIYQRKEKRMLEVKSISPFSRGFIRPTPFPIDSAYSSKKLKISIKKDIVSAESRDIGLYARLDLAGLNPLRICTRSGYRGWAYTEKTTPIKLEGRLRVKDRIFDISSPDAMALMDWSAGFMRRRTYWNWAASAAVLPDGRSFGLNLASGTNESSFTENAFWLDNKMTKVDSVNFLFDQDNLMKPWKISSYDKKIELEFQVEAKKSDQTRALVLATNFNQLSGFFSGTIEVAEGKRLSLEKVPGYVEDHYILW